MKKTNDVFDISLDEEEQEISDAIDRSELKSISSLEEEIDFARRTAINTLKKDSRVTIRMASNDLKRLKQKAAYKGLPYQTFLASILHEYAAGHFKTA